MTKKMKNNLTLVLGAGGIRGFAHISAIEFLKENKIKPDLIIGVSIGSVIGALYSYGKLEEFKQEFLHLKKTDAAKFFYPSLSRSGLFDSENFIKFLEKYIPRETKIEDLPIPIIILATNYQTGEQVLFKEGSLLLAIRASVSIPGFFVPVKYHEGSLVDGAVANPLPIDLAREMGAKKIIAISLHSFLKNRKNETKNEDDNASDISVVKQELMDKENKGFSFAFKNKYLSYLFEKKNTKDEKTPNLIEMMMKSMEISIFCATRNLIKHNKPEVLLEPNLMDVMVLDVTKAKKCLDEGKRVCEKAKTDLLKLRSK